MHLRKLNTAPILLNFKTQLAASLQKTLDAAAESMAPYKARDEAALAAFDASRAALAAGDVVEAQRLREEGVRIALTPLPPRARKA